MRDQQNLTDWYTDDKINTLLRHFFPANQIDQNLRVIPALPFETDIDRELLGPALTAAFADYGNVHQYFIPLRINENHWIGLYVDPTLDNPIIYWIDSLGRRPSRTNERTLLQCLNNSALFNVEIIEEYLVYQETPLQNDGYNCGPMMIEILRHIRNDGVFPILGQIDIIAARNEHSLIVNTAANSASTEKNPELEKLLLWFQEKKALTDLAINYFREMFAGLKKPVLNLKNYRELILHERKIQQMILEIQTSAVENLTEDEKKECMTYIESLLALIAVEVKKRKLFFFSHALNGGFSLKELLFGDIQKTSEAIRSYFKELSVLFHPDKNKDVEAESTVFFQSLIGSRDEILKDLEKKFTTAGLDEANFYKQEGVRERDIALQYKSVQNVKKNAAKDVDKERVQGITRLDGRALQSLTDDEIETGKKAHANLSVGYFRAAMQIIDQVARSDVRFIEKQVDIRYKVGAILSVAGDKVNAQLYILSALYLLTNTPNNGEMFSQLKATLDAIRVPANQSASAAQQPQQPSANQNTSTALSASSQRGVVTLRNWRPEMTNTPLARDQLKQDIRNEFGLSAMQCLIQADLAMVAIGIPKEDILRTRTKAGVYRAGGIATTITAVGVVATTVIVGSAAVFEAMAVGAVGGAIGGPIGIAVGAVIGLIVGIAGLFLGNHLRKKGIALGNEPIIRENINKLINGVYDDKGIKTEKGALDYYLSGNMFAFIKILGRSYGTSERDSRYLLSVTSTPAGDKLIRVNVGLNINAAGEGGIVKKLLTHGFRPDGIAYLLNALSEALVEQSDKFHQSYDDRSQSCAEVRGLAIQILQEIDGDELKNSADALDKKVYNARSESRSAFKKFFDRKFGQYFMGIPESYFTDIAVAPFTARLQEIQHIASINQAVLRVITVENDNLRQAAEILKKVKISVMQNYQYFSANQARINAVDDFLHAIMGAEVDTEVESPLLLAVSPAPVRPSLLNLDARLKSEIAKNSASREVINLHLQLAEHYIEMAKKEGNQSYIHGFSSWQDAKKHYDAILGIDKKNIAAYLGKINCLIHLHKFKDALDALEICGKSKIEMDNAQKSNWYYYSSIIAKNQFRLNDVAHAVHEGLKIDTNHKGLLAEKDINQKLFKKGSNAYLKELVDLAPKDSVEETYSWSKLQERTFYNIFSIDGGGVRGILAALWLAEIERRMHRPTSHFAHMLAGTSTGAIIAAGLSMPKQDSTFSPCYSASDLVELYRTESASIFTQSMMSFGGIFSAKYTAEGRRELTEQYFGNAKLDIALTELVITATNMSATNTTHLFTRHAARINPARNYTVFDSLMSTSAAPTFFPLHEFNGNKYADGGVQANNPSEFAYTQALSYGAATNTIRIWSLGTGDCISEQRDATSGALYWAKNLAGTVLPAQQGNADANLSVRLKDAYQRWQVWLDEPIGLDAYDKMDDLVQVGRAAIEEMDESDANPINRTVEALLSDTPVINTATFFRSRNNGGSPSMPGHVPTPVFR